MVVVSLILVAVVGAGVGIAVGVALAARAPGAAPGGAPISAEVARLTDLVVALQRDRAVHHGELVEGLRASAARTDALLATTERLDRALAGPRTRGCWGERLAEDVLTSAGYVEHVNFERQQRLKCGTVPDFTFVLPGDLRLHMDVKFPIDNYLRYLDADPGDDIGRRRSATAFVRDVRERIGEVAGRGYIEPGATVDAVVLFIPNEAVYGFIHEQAPDLADLALRHKVILCSPFTLFAVLGVIRQAVDNFALARTSDEILACLEGFRAEWDRSTEAVAKLERGLQSAQRALDELASTRTRGIGRQLDRIDELRARPDRAPGAPQRGLSLTTTPSFDPPVGQ